MKIALFGDVHESFRDFAHLLSICRRKDNPDLIIQVGDIAFFPRMFPESKFAPMRNMLARKSFTMWWIDGNHEDHSILQYVENFHTSEFNVFGPDAIYHPRGSYKIINGHVLFFVGGAQSKDRNQRVEGVDWFREEQIMPSQANYIFEQVDKVASMGLPVIVISHACPHIAIEDDRNLFNTLSVDSSYHSKLLSELLEILKPSLWFHGDMHKKITYKLSGHQTVFYSLPMIRMGYKITKEMNIRTQEVIKKIEFHDEMHYEVLELKD